MATIESNKDANHSLLYRIAVGSIPFLGFAGTHFAFNRLYGYKFANRINAKLAMNIPLTEAEKNGVEALRRINQGFKMGYAGINIGLIGGTIYDLVNHRPLSSSDFDATAMGSALGFGIGLTINPASKIGNILRLIR